MISNYRDTILRLGVKLIRVFNQPGEYVSGRFVVGQELREEFLGVLHPLTPDELKKLPEGRRVENVVLLYTYKDLIVGKEGTKQIADRIYLNDHEFVVLSKEDWFSYGQFFKYILARR